MRRNSKTSNSKAHLTFTVARFNAKWQHAVSAHSGAQFDYANIPGARDISSGENQMLYRIALINGF
jgi:hypothetical protein